MAGNALGQLPILPRIHVRLCFPQGYIDLAQVAAVHVEVPLALVEDMTNQEFHGNETLTELQDKTGPAMFHIHDTVVAALSARTDSRWMPDFTPFKLLRVKDTWQHLGIGFTIEQHSTAVRKDLVVDVICPSDLTPDRTMYCDVLPFKPPRLSIE
ncbi:hypothetical protein MYCTH_2128358 [Thermothelomyces thermophilus ATCC 42464]|uniref:Uncharacterized protein n=1 Tax=Thermothelomyces thermophilus (strain ATCC 42464 / BCRC 31852 / DSM 1799) TaxID=573729 RepID=G2QFZ0_THET4|nr:uncharacterized protein MYCTH_2128358 [Thermothelomyces thermophilus ATCC 42464]AEO59303.1 hypothetical protein MYCTH_2128358 [Thermothelomyces thermophilus ATCC 42464]